MHRSKTCCPVMRRVKQCRCVVACAREANPDRRFAQISETRHTRQPAVHRCPQGFRAYLHSMGIWVWPRQPRPAYLLVSGLYHLPRPHPTPARRALDDNLVDAAALAQLHQRLASLPLVLQVQVVARADGAAALHQVIDLLLVLGLTGDTAEVRTDPVGADERKD